MTGIIILAAGASTRMGKAKQLLHYNNKSLLQHAVDSAVNTGDTVMVVLGANARSIQREINHNDVHIVINDSWQQGMASSIRTGLSALTVLYPKVEDVILMLSDQPFVNPNLLIQLKHQKIASGKDIVACFYKEQPGVPALFNAAFFPELLALEGAEGAKKLFSEHAESVALVPFAYGSIDIDTLEDYNNLTAMENKLGKDFFNTWC